MVSLWDFDTRSDNVLQTGLIYFTHCSTRKMRLRLQIGRKPLTVDDRTLYLLQSV